MEKISVGVNGDGFIPEAPGLFDSQVKVWVKGGFPAQQDQIGLKRFGREQTQPVPDGVNGKGPVPMLRRIDIAVGTRQIASGQNMEKKSGRRLSKCHGLVSHITPCIVW